MPYAAVIDSPFGHLGIALTAQHLTGIDFLSRRAPLKSPDSPLARRVIGQFHDYFADPRHPFDLPLDPAGTAFQHKVWRAMRAIPPGQTRSYGQLAERLGSGARAVGGACRRNPLPIVIPCHRVVAAHGHGGYSGHTHGLIFEVKLALLAHEAGRERSRR